MGSLLHKEMVPLQKWLDPFLRNEYIIIFEKPEPNPVRGEGVVIAKRDLDSFIDGFERFCLDSEFNVQHQFSDTGRKKIHRVISGDFDALRVFPLREHWIVACDQP